MELTFTEMVEVSEERFRGRAGGGEFSSRCYSVAGAHDNLNKESEAAAAEHACTQVRGKRTSSMVMVV